MAMYFTDQGQQLQDVAGRVGTTLGQGLQRRREGKLRKAQGAIMEEEARIRQNRESGLGDQWRAPTVEQRQSKHRTQGNYFDP